MRGRDGEDYDRMASSTTGGLCNYDQRTFSAMGGFCKVKGGARAVNTTAAPLAVDRRFFPKDMRGLLEVYVQGSALQEEMASHCQETVRVLNTLNTTCQTTVTDLNERLEQTHSFMKSQAELPANVDWTPVLSALRKLDDIHPDVVAATVSARLVDFMRQMEDLEGRMAAKLTNALGDVEAVQQRRDETHMEELRLLRQAVIATQRAAAETDQLVRRSAEQLTLSIASQIQASTEAVLKQVQGGFMHQETSRQSGMLVAELHTETHLQVALAEQREILKADFLDSAQETVRLQLQTDRYLAAVDEAMQRNHKASTQAALKTEETAQVLHNVARRDMLALGTEIGWIQKSMNLEFRAAALSNAGHSFGLLALPGHVPQLSSSGSSPTTGDAVSTTTQPNMRSGKCVYEDDTRARDMWVQTERTTQTVQTMTDPNMFKVKVKKEKSGQRGTQMARVVETEAFDKERKKNKEMREALMKPKFDVTLLYHRKGCAQAIARSDYFERFTFAAIFFNSLWIAVDADYNNAAMLKDAHPIFFCMESLFCVYFISELVIRFLAFRKKMRCFKSYWFAFDFVLVISMVLETWVLGVVVLFFPDLVSDAHLKNASVLRMARWTRLLRMARVIRLLRMMPELVVIMKSIGSAIRSVSFFAVLTLIIIYVYALLLRSVTDGTELGNKYFINVPTAMNSLLVDGMLPLYKTIINDIVDHNPWYWPLIMSFVLLASVTIMNMLVGVLVEVVRTVSLREKESMLVIHVTQQLREVLRDFQKRNLSPDSRKSTLRRKSFSDGMGAPDTEPTDLSKEDFVNFVTDDTATRILADIGVDVIALLESVDLIFEDRYEEHDREMGIEKGITFVDFVEMVLHMRGPNAATVKDIKEQLRLMKTFQHNTSVAMMTDISQHMKILKRDLKSSIKKASPGQRNLLSDSESSEEDMLQAGRSLDGAISFHRATLTDSNRGSLLKQVQ